MGALLALLSFAITWFAATGEGLDRRGAGLVGYHLARLALAVVLGYAIFGVGRAVSSSADAQTASIRGLSLFSLGAFVLGLCGGYYTVVAIALLMLIVLFVPVSTEIRNAIEAWRAQSGLSRLALAAVVLFAVILFVNRALVPAETDNDVWEHYLHYYDAVLRNHSVWPNELWVHFYVSKAAGAFYMAGLLGDVFSVQLVSWLAVVLIGFLAQSLVARATGSRVAGLAAALLVFASWNVLDGRSGSFMKHHTVLAALLVSVFWCGYEGVLSGDAPRRRAVVLAGAAAALYTGLYITVAAGIAVAGLTALAAYFALFRELRRRAYLPLVIAAGAAIGAGLALVVNYVWTGLALDAPVGVFWPLADRERFGKLWSPLLIEYWFLGPASYETAKAGLATIVTPDLAWWARLLRAPYFKAMWTVALVAVAAAFAWRLIRRASPGNVRSPLIAAGAVGAFLLGVLVLSQVFRNSESVGRLYAFTLPFVICALVLLWQGAAAVSGAGERWPVQCALLLAALTCSAYFLRQVPADRWRLVADYAIGSASTRDAVRQAERTFPGRASTDALSEFRKNSRGSGRILFMTYDAAPAYFLPGPPVVSEPSYAFGHRYDELLFAKDPARTEEILKREGVEYVAFNLRNRLFLGLPYTELFSAKLLPARFGLAWEQDGIVILGWRSAGVTAPLPKHFLEALEAKKTGEIPDDAEDLWGAEVAAYMRKARATADQDSDYLSWLYNEMKLRWRAKK